MLALLATCLQVLATVQHTLPAAIVTQFRAAAAALGTSLQSSAPVLPQFQELVITAEAYPARKAALERLVTLDPSTLSERDRRTLLGLLVREHQRYLGTNGRLVFPSRALAVEYFTVLKRAGRALLPVATQA